MSAAKSYRAVLATTNQWLRFLTILYLQPSYALEMITMIMLLAHPRLGIPAGLP
jgi:hypothetical protein